MFTFKDFNNFVYDNTKHEEKTSLYFFIYDNPH